MTKSGNTPQTTMRLNWVSTGLCRAKAQDGAHLEFTLQKVHISSSVFSEVRICTPNSAGFRLRRALPCGALDRGPRPKRSMPSDDGEARFWSRHSLEQQLDTGGVKASALRAKDAWRTRGADLAAPATTAAWLCGCGAVQRREKESMYVKLAGHTQNVEQVVCMQKCSYGQGNFELLRSTEERHPFVTARRPANTVRHGLGKKGWLACDCSPGARRVSS
jgi:hypothetical protein